MNNSLASNSSRTIAQEVVREITDLLYDYVLCLDDDRLEEWPDFFIEDCIYKIVPRENLRLKADLPIWFCENKNMLRDRVLALRTCSVYNLHYDRHLISNTRVKCQDDGRFYVHSNYAVFQTDLIEGKTILFCTGKYEDEVVFVAGQPKFKVKRVILDTYSVPNLLATPV
ncbi:MAG: aromatic-ring-hydroxylating dioxygenase subunit beta [Dongiaceae bacterium]